MNQQLTFAPADDGLWEQYDQLATRAYGHPIGDITHLREHADLQVAVRGGRVVAGGLGLLVDQFFGGAPVPSACLGDGCVAPEERGNHLATDMTTERLRPLIERGAVISTISTSSTGYARRLGWEAPTGVLAWEVATDDLKRSFATEGFEAEHGLTDEAEVLQRELARQWNGPVHRPTWWNRWKQDKNNLTTYRFAPPDRPTTGLLSLATERHERHGMSLTVHDFWADSQPTAAAMLTFLGHHNTRAHTIQFRRGALPPYPTLLHGLRHHRTTAEAWHPWMLRILDVPAAIRLRGWPTDLTTAVPMEIENDTGDRGRWMLQVGTGAAEIVPTHVEGQVTFTRRQLAVWYAGGYRSTTSARMAGVHAVSEKALTTLVRSTAQFEPWLPDHF
ncbi:enhanced intracellular survival protein Eis [Streptomyces radicis]|uniref:GNAT family N-acetyltransferase n=1 Tax=Streptomyces radicis TaxID=1750517 RepID=A0A3A9W7T0_9ACTN|nr:GNAT family N-acetyltransferase [Streptomyces radicis]RKN08920.1 GNAT family N-acetyltransferase [Streptomyces radicis]RKN22888.1 GNAT family N-acetyltransferase [Streptomyces radicis]